MLWCFAWKHFLVWALLDDLIRGSSVLHCLVDSCLNFIFCKALQQKGTDELITVVWVSRQYICCEHCLEQSRRQLSPALFGKPLLRLDFLLVPAAE